jgi:Tol biopolymer transport system component
MTRRPWRRTVLRAAGGLAFGALLVATPALAGEGATTTQVDVGWDGPPDGGSRSPSISADGRLVVFVSVASNLVQGDTNDDPDVFVRDLESGSTQVVSGSHGAESYPSPRLSISADGRFVAFESERGDILVTELGTGETRMASADLNGHETFLASAPSISADGRYVAFVSEAPNLVAGDAGYDDEDVFVRDLEAGVTRRLTVGWTGAEPNGDSGGAAISADGRFVAFTSGASNLIRRDTNRSADVFVHNLRIGKTRRVSVGLNGAQSNGRSRHPSISADGRKVAFESGASNLVRRDLGSIYVRNLEIGRTRRVDVGWNGAAVNGGGSAPSISADGRSVAFTSGASNLVRGDRNGYLDVFVRDLSGAETRLVSLGVDGALQSRSSFQPSISADGRYVAFTSFAYRPPFLHSGWGDVYRRGPLR